jgi:hypothetical protein
MNIKWLMSRALWGVLFIAGGILFLIQNLTHFQAGDLFWAGLLGIGGVLFLSVFWGDRGNWWAIIPGVILLDLALFLALGAFFPQIEDTWGGALFLAGIGLSFWLVYLANRSHWWAVIPGGVLFTLALVAGFSSLVNDLATAGIFFFGIGLTFAILGILPTNEGRMNWAFIPAIVLVLMGLAVSATATDLINYIWPAALILVGGYLIYRAVRPRRV